MLCDQGGVTIIRADAEEVAKYKTVIIDELIHNMAGRYQGVSLFCGIGERCREAEEIYREMRDAGVLERAVLVFGLLFRSDPWQKAARSAAVAAIFIVVFLFVISTVFGIVFP